MNEGDPYFGSHLDEVEFVTLREDTVVTSFLIILALLKNN